MLTGGVLLPCTFAQQMPVPANTPLSVIVTGATLGQNGVLRCTWKIRNNGSKLIHVYSSYLKSSGVDMIQSSDKRTLLLLTTWINEQKNTYPAYGFDAPEFIDLEPGGEASGAFERSVSVRHIETYKKIILAVGYVTDIVQLRNDLQNSLKRGVEFQANSIIRWQKIEYSTPVKMTRH